jgi:hypothetical protein
MTKYLILNSLFLIQILFANEKFDYLLKDLSGIALYKAKIPFEGKADLSFYAPKNPKWIPPEKFEASTTTKEQLILFYKMPKNVISKKDIEGNSEAIITEIVGTVKNGMVQVVIESFQEEGTIFEFSIKDFVQKMNSKLVYK